MSLQLEVSRSAKVGTERHDWPRPGILLASPSTFAGFRELVEGLTEQVAIVDEDWTIVAVNLAWKQMVRVAGYAELEPGTNYLDFLRTFALKGHSNAMAVLAGIEAIERGERESFDLTYAGVEEWEGRTLQVLIHRMHFDGRVYATVSRHDITDTTQLRQLREKFNSSMMEGQADERRRLGRELHDSASQLLASIGIALGQLRRAAPDSHQVEIVDQMEQLLSETHKQIRAISYLAHPPALDRMGLADALKALAEGFGRRTELEISFESEGAPVSFAAHIQGVLYRVAQEALSNVHRHARASHAKVRLYARGSMAHLVISDDGIGVSDETLAGRGSAGVGFSSMHSRLAEIGGKLTVHRLLPGTAIVASIPSEG